VGVTPGGDTANGGPSADADSPPVAHQRVVGLGRSRQAIQVSGVQYNVFGQTVPEAEVAVSIAPPVGQRDERFPLRGRDQLLTSLAGSSPGLRVRVVHGLGGSGKTRLALEVSYQAGQRGVEVWWVSAADASRLVAGMQAVGRRLGVADTDLQHGEAADLVWQQLASRQQEWLLVIDNADEPPVLAGPEAEVADGTGWLRPLQSPAGLVVVTSRDGRASSWGPWCGLYPVRMLSARVAAQVLADHAEHHSGLGSDAEAVALAQRLGGLPLALKIAGSFLAESATVPAAFADPGLVRSYGQYQQAIGQEDLAPALPDPGDGELTPEQAGSLIERTWDLTLDRLEAKDLPEARRVLRLLASLADAPIPHELLLHPDTVARSPLFMGLTGHRLWRVLETLAGFGLIDLTGNADDGVAVARLHPLVRDISRPHSDQLAAHLALAARLLRRAAEAEETGLPEDPSMWPMWQVLEPHATYVFETLTSCADCENDAAEAAAYAAYMVGRYQYALGLYSQADSTLKAVLPVQEKVLGADDPSTLDTRFEIAVLMAAQGDHAGAEAELREVLAARLRVLGADNQAVLTTRHEIAVEMAERGDHAGAETELREVLAAEERVLDADNRNTLATRHEIARMMAERGDHEGAEAGYREVLAASERLLGAAHPATLAARYAVAFEIAKRGDHARAEAEYREVLAAEERVLGADHPSTLETRFEIAVEMAERGDHARAEAEYREVLAARLRVLGPDHPDTLASRNAIAGDIDAQENS
jgi:tetratricopeptide (TPR) repeat protein